MVYSHLHEFPPAQSSKPTFIAKDNSVCCEKIEIFMAFDMFASNY